MRRLLIARHWLATVTLAGVALGCNSFLTGDGLTTDPNHPTSATARNLFVASQPAVFAVMEGSLARATCVWLQQCSGVNNQGLSLGVYGITEGEFSWSSIYGGGALLDLRRIEQQSVQAGDSAFAGVAMVLEAYVVGTAADLWGDVPYTQADSSFATPILDPQQNVYDSVQSRLSLAITYLGATSPTNIGPTTVDFVYGGDLAKWRALAYTLKARNYLHTAEVDGASAYQAAMDAAASGIASPDGDYVGAHTGVTLAESNVWFQWTHAWPTLNGAGKYLVDLLTSTDDPRLTQDFLPVPANPAMGISQDTIIGVDPGVTASPGGTVSRLAQFDDPMFPQPLVTWAENELIIAESAYQLDQPGLALSTLETVRADAGLPALSPEPSGTALLQAIMTEKYIREFQNIEAWSDYRRTCIPALTPAPGSTALPARLLYPLDDRNTDPNIPPPSEQPARNWNDPNGC